MYIGPGSSIKSIKNSILFMPTNGAGLGHLTRTLAIARRIRKIDPNREIIFFTTSPAINLILQEGFLAYYIPSKMFFPDYIWSNQWNELLEKQLKLILQLHQPKTFVYDGAFVYYGVIAATEGIIPLKRIWIKRKQNKPGNDVETKNKENFFHHIIIPGEYKINLDSQAEIKYHYCNPVIYLDKSELLSKDKVKEIFKISNEYKLVYIQLGAGNINDIDSTLSILLSILEKRKDLYFVVGESIIGGKRLEISRERLLILKDYPNSRYYNAFDLAISAAGYNTFFELMHFGVPSIFIPNEKTKSDDQLIRSMLAEKAKAAIVLRSPNYQELENAIDYAINISNNMIMRNNTQKLNIQNGAEDIAKLILKL
ncbi:glycosyltransferase [Alkaliphilus sp. B6464]|uniref:glycosyltransferase n=1 Tax=Alkaliphilus sp. B6464 TaxID=2731219 RepID=UPI001BAAB3AC|nr:glycosyltransferase [Alkaliphilus sp. B6464]QUH18600.1 hypothetical protein HYG84_00880 [Alkaliphilus sp. B6464]